MLFNSFQFLFFFTIVYLLYRNLNHRWQNRLLLAASYIFYGSWDWRFLSLILTSTVVDYFCGLKIEHASAAGRRKLFLCISLACNLGLLGFFKYFNFFAGNLGLLLSKIGLATDISTLNIILPVGISFYTFQTLSYTIDIYRGKLKPEKNFFDFALFVSFFPQLVAGPIERASSLLPQVCNPRKILASDIREGLFYIVWGYYLKICLADNMALIVNDVFAASATITGPEAILGIYGFAFQIFGDFAGYSFIAIGVSKLMGFHLMTNFLFPYFVTNPSAFWRNWHISLSTWLRDYLYIPLGGNRNGVFLTYRNLFLTMLLGGLWHGAGWTFVLWGAYHGIILIIFRLAGEKSSPGTPEKASNPILTFFKIAGMFQLTCFGWLIFRAEDITQIKQMLTAIVCNMTFSSGTWFYYAATIIFYGWLVFVVQILQKKHNSLLIYENISYKTSLAFYMVVFYMTIVWGEFGGGQFIYFQF